MLNNFWKYITKSIESKVGGKISTTRISSYLILGSILTTTGVYLLIDLINAIRMWREDMIYTIPSEHIVVFGMVLTHHLALMGINKNAETKQLNGSNSEKVIVPKADPLIEKEIPKAEQG